MEFNTLQIWGLLFMGAGIGVFFFTLYMMASRYLKIKGEIK